MKAGTIVFVLEKSTFLTPPNINTPTYTNAAEQAALGMNANKGIKKIARINKIAVDQAVKPVLPPAAIPEPDSTNVVTVEVPKTAPAQVAIESDSIILL